MAGPEARSVVTGVDVAPDRAVGNLAAATRICPRAAHIAGAALRISAARIVIAARLRAAATELLIGLPLPLP